MEMEMIFYGAVLATIASVGVYIVTNLIAYEIKCNDMSSSTNVKLQDELKDKKKLKKLTAEETYNKCQEEKERAKASCSSSGLLIASASATKTTATTKAKKGDKKQQKANGVAAVVAAPVVVDLLRAQIKNGK